MGSEEQAVSPSDTVSATTFIAIPSYDDSDIEATCLSAIAMSAHEVRIGVCLQSDDRNLAQRLQRIRQVDVAHVPKATARGEGWARMVAQGLMETEEWYYQCDSHMRFEPNWDRTLIDQAHKVGGKPMITAYPMDWKEDGFTAIEIVVTAVSEAGLKAHGSWVDPDSVNRAPFPARMTAGGHLFAPASFVDDVPKDPRIFSVGVECSTALRAWTTGYDLWHPGINVVRHRYGEHPASLWTDRPEASARIHNDGLKRLAILYGREDGNLGKYGLGSVRTREQFQAYAGIDFVAKTVMEHGSWRARQS